METSPLQWASCFVGGTHTTSPLRVTKHAILVITAALPSSSCLKVYLLLSCELTKGLECSPIVK